MATVKYVNRVGDNGEQKNNMDKNSEELFEDVVLLVEDRKIKANSGILAFSSPIFASLLRRTSATQTGKVSEPERHISVTFPSPRYEFRSESSKAVQTRTGEPPIELIIPNHKYKDIKKTLSYLIDKNGERAMSVETAWKLLPIAEEYKVKIVKKKCGDVLLKNLTLLREGKQVGTIPIRDVLKYLACAEKYNFNKIRAFCIDECAANFEVTRRKDIAEDEHIAEKTKVKILEQMCENMSSDYEKSLKQIKAENDRRFDEVNRKMKQQKDVTDNWKEDTKQEVDAILAEAKIAHNKLVEELKNRNLDSLEESIHQLSEDVISEVGQINEQLQIVLEVKDQLQTTVEKLALTNMSFDEPEKLDTLIETCGETLKTVEEALQISGRHLEALANRFESRITTHLRSCDLEQIETSLANNFDLQDAFDRQIAENTAQQRALSDAEADVEKMRLEYEKTKAELRKCTKKISKTNTWIKWAKPVEANEDKCLCFRHVSLRSARH